MKKLNVVLWYLPLCFFLFLTIFIFFKFIFIFFFNAAFEPEFMFDLTPYYLLSGVNNLHLLLLSVIVVAFDAYLHFKISKKNLVLSFIPTGIMLVGIGFKIATQVMEISDVLYYLIFGFLLIIILTDNRHVLIFPETTISPEKEKIVKSKPIIAKIKSKDTVEPKYIQISETETPLGYVSANEILTLHKETLADLRSILKDDLRRAKDLLEELEHRTRKIDVLEEEIRNKKYDVVPQQMNLICPYSSLYDKKGVNDISSYRTFTKVELEKEKQIEENNANIHKFAGCAAIIKRGILKKVNSSFVDLLGFDKEILLEKSLFNFVAPEGLFKVEEYYLNRLKGNQKNSYETILLTNYDAKIQVEITMNPTMFFGEIADIANIKVLK